MELWKMNEIGQRSKEACDTRPRKVIEYDLETLLLT